MEKIYYISQGKNADEHLENIEKVCKSGVRLVQLRMKEVAEIEYVKTAIKAVEITHKYGGKLLVNDSLRVAYVANADGVHLGQNDCSPQEARKLLQGKIIGGTANTVEQCLRLIEQGVDYIGVGPYRFTETKKNLSPILGLEGYENILNKLVGKCNIPVYAIGGIQQEDIQKLLDLGLSGIAVSGMLTQLAPEKIAELLKIINN